MKIILFDIDGTLVKIGAHLADGKKLGTFFSYSLNEVFGVNADAYLTDHQGKTDKGIFFDVAERAGISKIETEKHMDELMQIGTEYIEQRISNATLYPNDGVKELLDELNSRGYHMGLLTGNIKKIAELKLTKIGFWHYFDFGGFGNLSEVRSKLIDYAINEAENKFKTKINKKEVFYFGDTPRDVTAGKSAGVVTISVATGEYNKKQLSKLNPEYVLDNFKDVKEILKIIENNQS